MSLSAQPWFSGMQRRAQEYYRKPQQNQQWAHGTETVLVNGQLIEKFKFPPIISTGKPKTADDELLRRAAVALVLVLIVVLIWKKG